MVVVATLSLFAGFTLLYAGVRGQHWHDPWQLWVTWIREPINGNTNPIS